MNVRVSGTQIFDYCFLLLFESWQRINQTKKKEAGLCFQNLQIYFGENLVDISQQDPAQREKTVTLNRYCLPDSEERFCCHLEEGEGDAELETAMD